MLKEKKEEQSILDEKYHKSIEKIQGNTEKGLRCQILELKREFNMIREENNKYQKDIVNRIKKYGEEINAFKNLKETILQEYEKDKEIYKESISIFNNLNSKLNLNEFSILEYQSSVEVNY